ncbi:DNA primase [Cryptosporangium minutisporangium]|uniref:DNA primase n=1 Tax=Cryptosporangium minutisporangium TaxID=113569 RepID=A0ABP6T3C6_9ACTN
MAGRHPEDVEPREDAVTDDEPEAAEDDAPEGERSARVAEYWAALGIDPVEIALPRGGVGLTLRQYRVVEEEPVDDDIDEELEAEALAAGDADDTDEDDDDRPARDSAEDEDDDKDERRRTRDSNLDDDLDDDLDDETALDDEEPLDEEPGRARVAAGEEEAVFLATAGKLHLFHEPESLVAFVKSGAVHDLADSESWAELVETITPDLVVPDDEDRYELDLVVENLRGGRDVWERDLIIGAGELARDLAYALELAEVEAVLAPGSPLDDLDEALRAKGFFGRRKLKRIGAEQVALAWRSVIGRITSSVEWHD